MVQLTVAPPPPPTSLPLEGIVLTHKAGTAHILSKYSYERFIKATTQSSLIKAKCRRSPTYKKHFIKLKS